MRQPDNLPAFCRVHRNGRPLIGMTERREPRRSYVSGCVAAPLSTPFAGHIEGGWLSVLCDVPSRNVTEPVHRIARQEVFRLRGAGLSEGCWRTSGCDQ